MSNTFEVGLLVCVAIIAAASLVQMIAMLRMGMLVAKTTQRLQPVIDTAQRELPGILQDARRLVTDTRGKMDTAASNLLEISHLAKRQATRADQLIGDFSDRLQLQMIRVDEAVSAGIAGFEQVLTTVQTAVVKPVQDFSALLNGVRTGLSFFFGRKSGNGASSSYQDEEMFI